MADLTDEEIAELRSRTLAPVARGTPAMLLGADVVSRLLDEIERKRYSDAIVRHCPHGLGHAPYCLTCCAQFDPAKMLLIHEAECPIRHERADLVALLESPESPEEKAALDALAKDPERILAEARARLAKQE